MALPVSLSGISVAVAPVGPFKSSGSAVTVYTIAAGISGGTSWGSVATSARRFQTFTTGSDTASITSVVFGLAKTGTPTDNITVDIYALDGSGLPTGSALGTSAAIAGSSLTSVGVKYTFTFATAVPVSPSTQYAAVLSRSGAVDAANFYTSRRGATGNVDASQTSGDYNQSTLTWGAVPTDNDLLVSGVSSTPAYYFFGRDGTTATTLQAFKSTAPDTSWASQTTKTGFTTAILSIAAYQVGNVIHMLVQDGTLATSVAVKYTSYDMASDTFLTTTETVLAAGALTGQVASGWGCSLVVRSGGNVVCFYNCVNTNTSGTPRARVAYRIRTGVNTYGTETRVDANTGIDNILPEVVLGTSDSVHFLWSSSTTALQRTLSSANVLQTATAAIALFNWGQAVSLNSSGTQKVAGFRTTASDVRYFDSANTPTINSASLTSGIDSTPKAIFVDGANFWMIGRQAASSDLYVHKSTDNGATWTSGASAFAATIASASINLSRDGNIYQRGNVVVIPYVVNDNGTLKYNEYTILTFYTLTAEAGAFTLTGIAPALKYNKPLAAAAGAFTFTGIDVTLTKATGVTHYTLTADTGAFAFAGQAVTLRYGHATVAATGTFAFAGQAATLAYGHKLTAEAGAFAFAGQAVTLRYGHALIAATGSFAFSGQAVTLRYGHALPIAAGAFTFTGQDASLRYGHKLTAETGAFTFDGQPVTLTYTLASKTIVAETGAFAFSGQVVDLDADHILSVTTGAFTFAGQAANLQYGHRLQAGTGSFAFAGNNVSLRIARHLTAETGAFIFAGSNVGFVQEGEAFLAAGTGSFTFTGGDVEFRIGTTAPPIQPPVLVRPSRPRPPPLRLPQPIIGTATTAQGGQTVDGKFWVALRAHVRVRETVFHTDAAATQAMSAAVLTTGLQQKVVADVRMRMMSSARSFQKPVELDATLEQALVLRAITGGEVPLAPDYFEDYELPDAVDDLLDA